MYDEHPSVFGFGNANAADISNIRWVNAIKASILDLNSREIVAIEGVMNPLRIDDLDPCCHDSFLEAQLAVEGLKISLKFLEKDSVNDLEKDFAMLWPCMSYIFSDVDDLRFKLEAFREATPSEAVPGNELLKLNSFVAVEFREMLRCCQSVLSPIMTSCICEGRLPGKDEKYSLQQFGANLQKAEAKILEYRSKMNDVTSKVEEPPEPSDSDLLIGSDGYSRVSDAYFRAVGRDCSFEALKNYSITIADDVQSFSCTLQSICDRLLGRSPFSFAKNKMPASTGSSTPKKDSPLDEMPATDAQEESKENGTKDNEE